MKLLRKYIQRERTRHGKTVYYFRRPNKRRIKLPNEYDTKEFWQAYEKCLTETAPTIASKLKEYSFKWLVEQYKQSARWKALAPTSQKMRSAVLKSILKTASKVDIREITKLDIQQGIERRSDTPSAAYNFKKVMSQILAHAVTQGFIENNPAKGTEAPKLGADGHYTWNSQDIETYQNAHQIGTRERLALDLLLYTGLRRGDAVRLRFQDIKEGVITMKTQKTNTDLFIPVLPPLSLSIDIPTNRKYVLETNKGTPFTAESFGNWFRKVCLNLGLKGRAHGLRKAGATIAAENGATSHELMAIFGWTNPSQADVYTKKADRKKLAIKAANKIINTRT